MQTIHLVTFKSTGETWHVAACEDIFIAEKVMAGYGITVCQHQNEGFRTYVKPGDPSQTATVQVLNIVPSR